MRSLSLCAVALAMVMSVGGSASAATMTLIDEQWASWSASTPGRAQDEPLDFAVHLAGPTSEGALNATNPSEEFVSASGYVFTGKHGTGAWAFTLASPLSSAINFVQGSNDLSFEMRNSSGARFRILLGDTAGGYFASDEVFDTVTANFTTVVRDLDSLAWSAFDTSTLTLGASGTPDLTNIIEVGFASLAGNSNTERINRIIVNGVAVPEPHTAVLLAGALLGFAALAWRRRQGRSQAAGPPQ